MPLRFALPAVLLLALAGILVLLLPAQDFTPSRVPSTLLGKPFPEFQLSALNAAQKGLKASDLRGRVTVINVFASWCVPCQEEIALFAPLSEHGIVLVGIAYKDRPQDTKRFLAGRANPFSLVVSDAEGRMGSALALSGVPETYLIDKEGIIRFHHAGALTAAAIRDIVALTQSLNARPPASYPSATKGR